MILSFRTDRPGQTVQTQIRSSLIRVYTVCHSICIVWTHYSMAEPHSSNFRVITTNFLGVRIVRKFTVCQVEEWWLNVTWFQQSCRKWTFCSLWHPYCTMTVYSYYMGRTKRIWYLSPMRAAKVQASLRSLARTSAGRSYKQWVTRTESQIPSPSEWLGMRS